MDKQLQAGLAEQMKMEERVMVLACGLDFGTSNSTIGMAHNSDGARLFAVEGDHVTLPSAVFFSFEDNAIYFGRQAIAEYVDGGEGRLMRALKSVLGTSLMRDKARIKDKQWGFDEIVGLLIGYLKKQAEASAGQALSSVVLGRPVYFVDNDPVADAAAQAQLERAARAQGFSAIDFQFEPIAAALDYEQRVTSEKIALIIDIGGGTADFSIVRVGPERIKLADRKPDVLANTGVHIGGTDFDKLLSLSCVMPELGYRTPYANGKLDLPARYYFELATWQRINGLYSREVMIELRKIEREAMYPHKIARLMELLDTRHGHALAGKVEDAKVALTDAGLAQVEIPLPSEHVVVSISKADFEDSISEAVATLCQTIDRTLALAGLNADAVDALFLTGGTTQIPLVKQTLLQRFKAAEVVQGDTFGSVGVGLALDAVRKFG